MFADDSSDDMLDLLNFLDMVSALYKASFMSTQNLILDWRILSDI